MEDERHFKSDFCIEQCINSVYVPRKGIRVGSRHFQINLVKIIHQSRLAWPLEIVCSVLIIVQDISFVRPNAYPPETVRKQIERKRFVL